MQPATTSLFEAEIRAQIEAAESAVIDSLATGDPLLVEAARGHLDGLVDLAKRNGVSVKPLVLDEAPAPAIEPVVAPAFAV